MKIRRRRATVRRMFVGACHCRSQSNLPDSAARWEGRTVALFHRSESPSQETGGVSIQVRTSACVSRTTFNSRARGRGGDNHETAIFCSAAFCYLHFFSPTQHPCTETTSSPHTEQQSTERFTIRTGALSPGLESICSNSLAAVAEMQTDSRGVYSFEGLRGGTFTVVANRSGFTSSPTDVESAGRPNADGRFAPEIKRGAGTSGGIGSLGGATAPRSALRSPWLPTTKWKIRGRKP